MMNGYSNGGFPVCGGGLFGFDLPALVLFGLVIWAGYWFFKNRKQPAKKAPIFPNDNAPSLDAKEIARLRYARGEITFEEFQTILKNIQF